MAGSRKKIVGVAASGLPSPLRKVLGTRLVALSIVAAFPVLLATGIVSVEWERGRPRLSINRQRAAEARQAARDEIEDLREQIGAEPSETQRLLPQQESPWVGGREPVFEPPRVNTPDSPQLDRSRGLRDAFPGNRAPVAIPEPRIEQENNPPRHTARPLANLKDRLEDLR